MIRVLFLCQNNNGLSQIAEGLINLKSSKEFKAYSAGITPLPIQPLILSRLASLGIPSENHSPKSLQEFASSFFDYVLWLGEDSDPGYLEAKINWPQCKVWHLDMPKPHQHTPDDFLKKLDIQIQYLSNHAQLFMLCHNDPFKFQRH